MRRRQRPSRHHATDGAPAEPSAPHLRSTSRRPLEAALRGQPEAHAPPSVTRFGTNAAPHRLRVASANAASPTPLPRLDASRPGGRPGRSPPPQAAQPAGRVDIGDPVAGPRIPTCSRRGARGRRGAVARAWRGPGTRRPPRGRAGPGPRGPRPRRRRGRAAPPRLRRAGQEARRRSRAPGQPGGRATALEEERDEALYEVGALRAADAERAANVRAPHRRARRRASASSRS